MPLKLMIGIRHFKNNAFPQKKSLFDALKGGQSPEILFITCSDSRIIPSLITHAELGDLFVIRNAGNIVPPYSTTPSGEAATIEFALKKLKVKEIIICGHSHCGAMHGLLTPNLGETLPAVAAWLTHAHSTLERLEEKYPGLADGSPLKLMRTTKENILVQVENLKTHPLVREKLALKELNIHAWLYEFESGEILMYNQAHGDFIPFEDAVTEAFSSDYILNKMTTIVEEEAMRYLATKASPKTLADYQQLMDLFQALKLKGVGIIWGSIKEKTTARLWSEFGELCETVEEGIDPRFTALVERCLEVKPSNLKSFQKDVLESPGYWQFCGQMMRRLLRTPVLPSSMEVSLDEASFKFGK